MQNAIAFSDNDVITIAWSYGKQPVGCMGFAIYRINNKNNETPLPSSIAGQARSLLRDPQGPVEGAVMRGDQYGATGSCPAMTERPQSLGEEIANSLSHGFGFVAAVASAPILVVTTAQTGRVVNVIGAAIFAVTMVLLYCASTIYHAVPNRRAKALLRKLDHGAIFLLIAGTYTPFTLGALSGPWGWTLLGIVWSLAAIGVTLKAFDRIEHPLASLGLYLLMGWLCVFALGPLLERVPWPGLVLLGAGGFAYMAGVAFFATDSRVRYGHFIWHLFVLAGTGCHFFAVLGYAA